MSIHIQVHEEEQAEQELTVEQLGRQVAERLESQSEIIESQNETIDALINKGVTQSEKISHLEREVQENITLHKQVEAGLESRLKIKIDEVQTLTARRDELIGMCDKIYAEAEVYKTRLSEKKAECRGAWDQVDGDTGKIRGLKFLSGFLAAWSIAMTSGVIALLLKLHTM